MKIYNEEIWERLSENGKTITHWYSHSVRKLIDQLHEEARAEGVRLRITAGKPAGVFVPVYIYLRKVTKV